MTQTMLIALALALPAPAAPVQTTEQRQVSAVELFALAAKAEGAGRPDDAETMYRALARDPDAEIRAEARFRLGQLLERMGRKREAATTYRALLDEKPDAARVRLELARLLTQLGDEGAARRELRQAQAGGLPPQVAQLVDQFAAALRSRKPWGASLEVALVPDSNVNRATDAATLDTVLAPLQLSRDAREQSGIGARIGGQLYARVPVAANLALVPRVSGQGDFYDRGRFNDVSASALVGLEWSLGRDRLRPSIGGTQRWYGGSPYARTATAAIDWQHPLGSRAQLTTSATIADTRYRGNRLQDGLLLNGAIAYERAFSARAGGSLTLSATRQTANDPGYATAGGGASLLGWREFGRTTVYATIGLRRLEGDARLFLFPQRRKEWNVSLGLGGTFRRLQIHGFAPIVRLDWERNRSTVGIYDYVRKAATIGLTRAF
ncbi:surface lipoprotein assembly modifier [Sphingomonas sp. R1]|uniref:surface lipoprotein assembly modifier n=1 Tax=Sphingomonas sp. R1 TaxID=399176 RepID=UPI0022254713|nr:surface lipoprotein assembly modifier [Sphingomonas sp. R1]UYY79080.1 surface lipoprotein assembly modifier [Sphingomonas sp. R1]